MGYIANIWSCRDCDVESRSTEREQLCWSCGRPMDGEPLTAKSSRWELGAAKYEDGLAR